MIVLASKDEKIATLIGRLVRLTGCIAQAGTAKELRYHIHELQPRLLILDVRIGGSTYRALGSVPRLTTVRSRPATLAILPCRSIAAERAAMDYGCVDVLSSDDPSFFRLLPQAVKQALSARVSLLRAAGRGSDEIH